MSNDYAQIQKILKVVSSTRPDIKVLVIDDANYLLSNATFKDALTKGTKNSQFKLRITMI